MAVRETLGQTRIQTQAAWGQVALAWEVGFKNLLCIAKEIVAARLRHMVFTGLAR